MFVSVSVPDRLLVTLKMVPDRLLVTLKMSLTVLNYKTSKNLSIYEMK